MIKLKNILLEALGDCYQAGGRLITSFFGDDDHKLVHGMVAGQGDLTGYRFGHCWVESKDTVLDHSNGRKLEIPKQVYYAIGRIDPKECKYYTAEQAAKFMVDEGHWGPWEMSGDTVLAEDVPDRKPEIGKQDMRISSAELEDIESKLMMGEVDENFADGKKPGRKGISKRVGIPKGATLTQLAKLAKAKGEKGRMARWQLNMRRGKKKAMKESVTRQQLASVEKYADRLFAAVGIDVEFTRHFMDRVNDPRNDKPISSAELIGLFKRTYKKYGKKIPKLGANAEAVITDMSNDINMPFVLQWDPQNQEFDLISKTIMRKKGFATSNQKLRV